MLGLFGTLDLARRALQTQQEALSVTSHNIANASNPTYARQRVAIQSSPSLPTMIGQEGTGADVVGIQQIRSALLDTQIQNESSVTGFWTAQQNAFFSAQAALGEQLDRTSAATSVGTIHGLGDSLADLFNSMQSLTNDPSSLAERTTVLNVAQNLAARFNQISQRLDNLTDGLNASLTDDVSQTNQLLGDITKLNDQIMTVELAGTGTANDLRDLRQQKLETLAQLAHIDVAAQTNGAVNVSIAGTLLVSGNQQLDSLSTYDPGNGNLLVQTTTGGVLLTLTSGSMQGTIAARDGEIAGMSADLDTLAGQLITAVNTIHQDGFSLTGSTGAAFFTGSNARDIGVNAALVAEPRLLQASGVSGATGDNQIALRLAQLANQPQVGLGNQTFGDKFSQIVVGLGIALASVNGQMADQDSVTNMLQQQRASVSGVSLDEEVVNLTRYQRAFEASARILTTVDEMLQTVVNLKR